jgi:membrane peptidoglycan carboxypeptidase
MNAPDPGRTLPLARLPRGRRPAGSPRGARRRRWPGRLLRVLVALIAVVAIGFAALMLLTPSVGNAWSLARAKAGSHHERFPGPPVPRRFAAALIATEDHRFASEPGFDPFALPRIAASVLTGKDQGGATLYQQLAKLLYGPGQSRLTTEADEVALGIKLKYSYSRQRILQMYADVAYFGHGYYGLAAASCGYFGQPASRLSWPQSAVLAGLVQAPSAYDPLRHPGLARSREGHVLSRLAVTGVLTMDQANRAFAVPMRRLLAAARGC